MPWKDLEIRRQKRRELYQKNRDKKLAYHKKWRSDHLEQMRAIGRACYAAHHHNWYKPPAAVLAARAAAYQKKNRVKLRANDAIKRALRDGKMIRPNTCSRCLVPCKPQGHHYNGYEREHWLEVEWLCIKCHNAEHVKKRLESLGELGNSS